MARLSFDTTRGYRYAVQLTSDLFDPTWVGVKHSHNSGDPATLDSLDGTSVAETVFVDVPRGVTEFFRIRMQDL